MTKKKVQEAQVELFSTDKHEESTNPPAKDSPTDPAAPQKTPKRHRTMKHTVQFESDRAKGWVLKVGTCFRPALDIIQTERVVTVQTPEGEKKRKQLAYTEGKPPLYSFAVGDTIGTTHFPNDGSEDHLLVQVLRASPDQWNTAEGKVVDGWLQVAVYRPDDPKGWQQAGSVNVTQREFVEILKTGQVPQ